MVTKAKKALLASLAAFLCVMLTVFGLSVSVSFSETAKADDTAAVAKIGETNYAKLSDAVTAATEGNTVTLLMDTTEDVVVDKNITLDLGGYTLTGKNSGKATVSIQNGATTTVKNGSIVGSTSYYTIEIKKGSNATATFEDLTATAGNTGSSMIDNWGTLTINSGTYTGGLNVVKSEEGSTLVINGGKFTLNYSTNGYTGVILVYGDTTINGGEFIQSLTSCGRWDHPQVIATGVVEGYTATTKVTGGSFTNLCSGEGIFRGIGKATSDNFEVSGGTFNKSISEGFCADGFIPTRQADGTYGVKEGKYVAKVGSTKYETLADAIRLAAKGKTITLLDNITLTEQLVIGKALTIDLGGFTLTSNYSLGASGADRYAIVLNAAVTIKNGKIVANNARVIGAYAAMTMDGVEVTNDIKSHDATVALCADGKDYAINNCKIDGSYSVSIFANNATVTITDSKLIGRGNTLYHNGSNYGLKLTVTGTTITTQNVDDASCGVYISGSTAAQSNAANQNGAGGYQQATFTGCTISGVTNGIEVKYTNLTLEDCSVLTQTTDPTYTPNNNGPATTGFAVVATDNSSNPVPEGTIIIKGTGNYTGLVGLGSCEAFRSEHAEFEDASYAVSGGTFDHAILPEYCADGFIPTQNADGKYGVKVGVAEVNGVKYETLQAAIDAAPKKATVKLLADTRENVVVDKVYELTFDLNGFTLNGGTGNKNAAILNHGTLTITDSSAAKTGTIKRDDNGDRGYYVILNLGTMTIEQANVVNNSGHDGSSLIRNGGNDTKVSTLTINGGEFTQNDFIAIKNDSTAVLNINGGIINSENQSAVQNWSTAHILGGTLNGVLWTLTYDETTIGKTVFGGEAVLNGRIYVEKYSQDVTVEPYVSITGGTLNVTKYKVENSEYLKVSGGTFSSEVEKDYLADRFVVNKNTNGTYGVTAGSGFAGACVVVTESLAMKVVVSTASKYVVVTYKGLDGIAKTVRLDKFTDIKIENTDYKYCLFDQIMPQMIDVKFSFELYGENGVMLDRKANYSVVDYLADIIKRGKDSAEFRNVAASLIEYANRAKAVKGLATTVAPTFVDKAGKTVTLDYKAFVAKNKIPAKDTLGAISEGDGQVIYKARVVFDDAYTLTFYTNDNEKQYTYKLDDKDIVFDENGEYTVNVLAQNITTKYVLTVYDKDSKLVQTVTYGVSTYCIRMQETETPQGELYVASYYYGVAVNQYGTANPNSVQG